MAQARTPRLARLKLNRFPLSDSIDSPFASSARLRRCRRHTSSAIGNRRRQRRAAPPLAQVFGHIKVRSKMLYASSKDRFKRELDGIQVELQATDPTEMSLEVYRDHVY